jgi:cystathionine beta-lyase/cystathionine gamma-synthase
MEQKFNKETLCVQAGWTPKKGEPRVLPIYQSTTFKYDTSEQMARLFDLEDSGYFYTRLQNPTNDAVAAKIAANRAYISTIANCVNSHFESFFVFPLQSSLNKPFFSRISVQAKSRFSLKASIYKLL